MIWLSILNKFRHFESGFAQIFVIFASMTWRLLLSMIFGLKMLEEIVMPMEVGPLSSGMNPWLSSQWIYFQKAHGSIATKTPKFWFFPLEAAIANNFPPFGIKLNPDLNVNWSKKLTKFDELSITCWKHELLSLKVHFALNFYSFHLVYKPFSWSQTCFCFNRTKFGQKLPKKANFCRWGICYYEGNDARRC